MPVAVPEPVPFHLISPAGILFLTNICALCRAAMGPEIHSVQDPISQLMERRWSAGGCQWQ